MTNYYVEGDSALPATRKMRGKKMAFTLAVPANISLTAVTSIVGIGGDLEGVEADGWVIERDKLTVTFDVPLGFSPTTKSYSFDIQYTDKKQPKLASTWREILAKLA